MGLIAGVLAPILILGVVVGVILFLRDDARGHVVVEHPDAAASAEAPPLVILGVTLRDGPLVDPTDVLHVSHERVAANHDPANVRLLGIVVRGAVNGRVNLDDAGTSVTYQFLVIHRDVRASKADERRGERVELNLQRAAPQEARMDVAATTRTCPEPSCVWSAAWSAAVASGLAADEPMDVVYGLDPKGVGGLWTFATRNQPKKTRIIDGQTCVIKNTRQ